MLLHLNLAVIKGGKIYLLNKFEHILTDDIIYIF